MSIKIEFQGPFHLLNIGPELNQKLNHSGIYIWGFMVDDQFNPIHFDEQAVFNPKKMQFLPYYVGKKKGNILSRLKEHYGVRKNASAKKYTRISAKYLPLFFKDKKFPVKTNYRTELSRHYIQIDQNSNGELISYYNHSDFLLYKLTHEAKNKVNVAEKKNNPITNFQELQDPLDEWVNEKNNFWFCYGIVDKEMGQFDKYLEYLETLTFNSLKGKTISKTGYFDRLPEDMLLVDLTLTQIFKEKTCSKEILANKYFAEGEIEFSGY
jgi:hypothetical protein